MPQCSIFFCRTSRLRAERGQEADGVSLVQGGALKLIGCNIGGLNIRIGFWGPLYFSLNKVIIEGPYSRVQGLAFCFARFREV